MQSKSFRILILACAAVAASGVALGVLGAASPVYTVPYNQARDAFDAWCTDEPRTDHAAGARYLALFGWHYALINAGVALIAAAVSIAALFASLQISSPSRPWLRTPNGRVVYVLLGIAAMLGYLPGIIHGLSLDLNRNYFPVCADSIGIPIYGLTTGLMVVIPVLVVVGALITLGFGRLPVSLGQWDRRRPVRSWVVTLALGAAFAACLTLWAFSIFSADLITPSSVLILYLIAATRAALLAPRPQLDDALPPNA